LKLDLSASLQDSLDDPGKQAAAAEKELFRRRD
jgi:hypothetical protein